MNPLTKILLCVVLAPVSMSLHGYVLTVLWRWFAVPTFGLPPLTVPLAIGLTLLLSFVTYQVDATDPGYAKKPMTEMVAGALLRPLFVLAFAWVVLQFV